MISIAEKNRRGAGGARSTYLENQGRFTSGERAATSGDVEGNGRVGAYSAGRGDRAVE